MKKMVVFLMLLLLFLDVTGASGTYPMGAMKVRGYKGTVASLELDPSLENMPFDLASDDVQPVTTALLSTSPGWKIGTWSLFVSKTSEMVSIAFTCGDLMNGSSDVPYYLQVTYPTGTNTYSMQPVSSGDGFVTIPLAASGGGYYDVKLASLYVRLKNGYDKTSLANNDAILGGSYISDVSVSVTVGS